MVILWTLGDIISFKACIVVLYSMQRSFFCPYLGTYTLLCHLKYRNFLRRHSFRLYYNFLVWIFLYLKRLSNLGTMRFLQFSRGSHPSRFSTWTMILMWTVLDRIFLQCSIIGLLSIGTKHIIVSVQNILYVVSCLRPGTLRLFQHYSILSNTIFLLTNYSYTKCRTS